MKKLLLLIAIVTINAFGHNSKQLLDDAIRQNNVEIVGDILQKYKFTDQEKYRYYELAQDIIRLRLEEKNIAAFQADPAAVLYCLVGMGFTAGAILFGSAVDAEKSIGGKLFLGAGSAFNAFVAYHLFKAAAEAAKRPAVNYQNSLTIKQMILALGEVK